MDAADMSCIKIAQRRESLLRKNYRPDEVEYDHFIRLSKLYAAMSDLVSCDLDLLIVSVLSMVLYVDNSALHHVRRLCNYPFMNYGAAV